MIGEEVWFVRTIYHVVEDKLYHDVRKWKDVSNELMYGYDTTEDGLTLSVEDWPLLLPQLLRQSEKHRTKEKRRK